ncbi:MAG: two-component regulator propeller domain-containing protein [Cyclobacteriaceae bacterium]
MHSRLTILFIICCGINLGQNLFGQARRYSFLQLTEEQGLSQNFVYGITEDERGFLWIGTGAGLSRYDGYEMKNLRTRDSLSADFITADFRTASGNLMFGHNQGGVTLFDGLGFHPLLPDTLGSKVVSISEDSRNNFWIATQSKGFVFIDRNLDNTFNVFPQVLQDQVINVTFSRDGILWVGTDEGVFFFRMKGSTLTPLEAEVLPAYVGVYSIVPHNSDPELSFVGTASKGIYLLKHDKRLDKIVVQQSFQLPAVSRYVIQAIAQDPDGDLWVGTRQNGLLHLNIGQDRKSIFKINYFGKKSGFPFTSVNKLIVDRQGQVWVGTMGDGLVKIYREFFTYFPFAARYGVGAVRSIAETASGHLVATDQGLFEITLDHQSDEYHVDLLSMLKGESILSVYTDSKQNTWVGTETRGVFIFRDGSKNFQPVSIDPQTDPVEIRLFEEDNNGNIWMSARALGVYVLNPARKLIKHITTANRFIHNDVYAIKADSKGNIWFGTYSAGLAMMKKDGELLLFSAQDSLRARDINDIDEDDAGNIWIATEGEGFFKYSDQKFTQIGSGESLMSPFIKGIQFDPTGRIWYSYRKGLGYFDLQSEKKYHFTRQDGLLASEAYSSSIIVDSKLNKWFCNDYGVTLFEHDTITDNRRPLKTYLTGIRIFFKDLPADLRKDNESGGSMVGELPPLELSHEENHITFDFAAINLNRASKIYYRHLLEGYDLEWTPAKTSNVVTYTNLDPGKYVLKVQATDDIGTWVDPITEYSFEITPPYWKETWFYLLQIISVITLFTLTYLIGKRGIARKRFVLRLMLFSSFFITLEYVENFIDPLVSGFFGGAPVFRFFLNFLLALILLPVETIIAHWLTRDEKKLRKDGESISEKVMHPENVFEEEKIEPSRD